MKLNLAAIALGVLAAGSAWAQAPDVYKKKCELCHSIAGSGGPKKEVGGPLDGVGSKRDAAWLRAYIKDPKSQMPEAKMPKMPLNETELEASVTYMESLK